MNDGKGAAAPGFQSEQEATDYCNRRLRELKRSLQAGKVRTAQAQALALSLAISRLAQIRESGDG